MFDKMWHRTKEKYKTMSKKQLLAEYDKLEQKQFLLEDRKGWINKRLIEMSRPTLWNPAP